jgi:ribonuclease Z
VYFAFLGTSGAVASLRRDNTSLVVCDGDEAVLVDVAGSPVQRLLLAAVDPLSLVAVVVTHIHVDHAYGLPSLLRSLQLMGRRAPLAVRCRPEHVEPLTALLRLFRILDRPGSFPIGVERVPAGEGVDVAGTAGLAITASPNAHGPMANMALRFAPRDGRGAVVYSSDTEPCEAVVRLAAGADTLIHEATFLERDGTGHGVHSTAAEAGAVAARAGVRRLILTHLDPAQHDATDALVAAARRQFPGVIEVAEEFVPYPM